MRLTGLKRALTAESTERRIELAEMNAEMFLKMLGRDFPSSQIVLKAINNIRVLSVFHQPASRSHDVGWWLTNQLGYIQL